MQEDFVPRHELDSRLKGLEIGLDTLDRNMGRGFSGVHSRLDELNGQSAENTKFRQEMQWERSHDKDMRGEFRAWVLAAVAAVAVINGAVMVLVR